MKWIKDLMTDGYDFFVAPILPTRKRLKCWQWYFVVIGRLVAAFFFLVTGPILLFVVVVVLFARSMDAYQDPEEGDKAIKNWRAARKKDAGEGEPNA